MAISDKLTYLNTTKTLIKDNLNLGGANISNEPFRVYSSKLIDIYKDFLAHGTDTLWNNWNKVNGTGESLTLNNTIKGKMKIDLKGNTSQEGTPTPDTPIPVNVVTGDNDIVVCGKNLMLLTNQDFSIGDLHYSVNEGVLQATGSRNPEVQRTNNSFKNNFKMTLSAGTYKVNFSESGTKTGTLNYYIMKYSDNSEIKRIQTTYDTFTLNEETEIYLGIYSYQLAITGTLDIKIMLCKDDGTTPPYEPYQSTTYPINLGSMELCKIGDYQDYIYKDNGSWYLHKEIGKVVLDGTQIFELRNTTENGTKTYSLKNDYVFDYKRENTTTGYSNYFTYLGIVGAATQMYTDGYYKDIVGMSFYYSSGYAGKAFYINTKDDLSVWLSTHNTIVYYVLATPTYTEITDTTLISQLEAIKLSYNEQTNISQENNDKPFILDVTALGELEGGN